MRGRINSFLSFTAKKGLLVLELDGDFRHQYDKLKDCDVEVTIEKYSDGRTQSANALLWKMCTEIAKKIGSTKEEVYRDQIRQVGEYTPLPIKESAVDDFARIWSSHGIGWFVEVIDDSKLPGYKLVFAYQGSSTYNKKQMNRLIDSVIDEAKNLGIETISEKDRGLLFE